MQFKFKYSSYFLVFFIAAAMFSLFAVNGCDDAGVENNDPKANPNVKSYDSIWVEENESAGSFNGINLLDGVNTARDYFLRDAGLAGGQGATGNDFYLRSGTFDRLLDIGYDTKWFQVFADTSGAAFDTLGAVYTNIGSEFDTTDFTQNSTEFWGFFNYPLDSKPVYCFWLKGKRDAGLTNGKNVFGILQPVESFDTNPGAVFGYSMTFRVRININGENDFRKMIPSTN